jgi:hypothetical protein
MKLVIILAFIVSACCTTIYTNPNPPPSFDVSYSDASKLNHLQANLTYMSGENLLYTYVFSFKAWTQSSSLFSPDNCTNRRWQDFNANNPILWNNLWSRIDELTSSTAISGSYLAWPTPALPWNVSIGNLANSQITYDGYFTIDELVSCIALSGGSMTKFVTTDYFIYSSVFYIVWVQPLSPYLPGMPFTGEYSTRSYAYPFVISINRNVDTIDDQPHEPSFIYSYILIFQWETYMRSLEGDYFRLHLLFETKTPASVYSSGVVANYNSLSPLSTFLSLSVFNTLGLTLYMNETESFTNCTINSQLQCVQKWAFYTVPLFNISVDFNDTYTFNALIESCATIGECVATVPQLVTSIPLSFDIFLNSIDQVNIVNEFYSNITYYMNASFIDERKSTNYISGESVYFDHKAYLYPIDPDFYSLYVNNLYVCSTIGGYAPYLGYDTTLGLYRYGCSREETINGIVNIPSSLIFTIVANETNTTVYDFEYYKLSTMVSSEVGCKFSLVNIQNLVSDFYIHVESVLYTHSTQSVHFEQSSRQLLAQSAQRPLYNFGLINKLHITKSQTASLSSASTSPTTLVIVAYAVSATAGVSIISVVSVVLIKKKLSAMALKAAARAAIAIAQEV